MPAIRGRHVLLGCATRSEWQMQQECEFYDWQILPNRYGHDWLHPYNPGRPTLGGDGCVDSSKSVPKGLVVCIAV
ncbi:hypothetical protein [Schlesneria sp. T3-172]|uniref:hypothetical protein n=1 Tax=Schlesneria sphaerica TaxID=3373610 RepID=UPI0037CB653C